MKSILQKRIAASVTEAECVSLINYIKHALALRKLIKKILNKEEIIQLYCDNEPCLKIIYNENSKGRTKHMDTNYKFIKENILFGKINLTI